MTVCISAVGVAAPTLRLSTRDVNAAWGKGGGRGQSAVCASDEDTLTLAWTACDRALSAADLAACDIDGLWWGTTRPPFAEGPSWTHLAAVLRLGPSTDGSLCSGSTHAGIEALLAAADAVTAGRVQRALVVMSESLLPGTGTGVESATGAGAAAVLLTNEGPAPLGARVTHSVPVLDRYRGDREATTREAYDGRLFREEVYLPLLTDVGRAAGATDDARWSLPDPDGRLGPTLGRKLAVGALSSAESRAELGDTGSASPLIGIAAALATVGPAVVMAYGGGRGTALNIDVQAPVPGADRVADDLGQGRAAGYTEVLRARGQLIAAGESVEMAVPPGSAMFVRGNVEVLGLLGARCVECGTVNTPPSIHPACISCGSDKFDIVPLARKGTVQTFVINHTMPAPFEAPLPLVVVDLEDGSRIQLQGATTGEKLVIGGPVELILRRYSVERGVPIYGWKVREITEGSAS